MTNLPRNPKPNFEKIEPPSRVGKFVGKVEEERILKLIAKNKEVEKEVEARKSHVHSC